MKKAILAALVPVAALLATPAAADHHGSMGAQHHAAAMESALAAANRAEDRARDEWRHPAETLSFFRVMPGQTVVDYMPSSGWYTRVLVPYLGTDGRYIGLNPDPASAQSDRFRDYVAGLAEKFPASLAKWGLQEANARGINTNEVTEAMNGTVDRVLIFREMHNLHRFGALHAELGAIHDLLKDDGMLGIVQHRAKPWAPASYTDGSNGYMRQQDVIGLVEAHGFDLVETSEINANDRDTADHEGGVWMLKPSGGSKGALDSIGESDRMTLLFRKRD